MASPSVIFEFMPEEIIEEIIGHALHRGPTHAKRPLWHIPRSSPCSPLYVSKQWGRIGTPLLYADIELNSYEQAVLLQRTLAGSEDQASSATSDGKTLARYIRHLTVHGIWAPLGPIMLACARSLVTLDMTLDATSGPWAGDFDDEESERVVAEAQGFCDALHREASGCGQSLRILKVRKSSDVYLTVTKVKYVLGMLASAVKGWDKLEDAQLLFRMSDDSSARSPLALSPVQALTAFAYVFPATPPQATPIAAHTVQASSATTLASATPIHPPPASATIAGVLPLHVVSPQAPITINTNVSAPSSPSSPTSPSGGPITQLTASLAACDSLRTFVTQLPSLWNTTVLAVAQNERLEKVVLLESITQGPGGGPNEAVFGRRASFAIPAGGPGVQMPSSATSTSSNAVEPSEGASGRYPGAPVSITSTGMWMLEARKHPRLVELVKAGQPSVVRPRIRAFTSMRPTIGAKEQVSSSGASSSCSTLAPPSSPSRSRAPPSAFAAARNANAAAIASSAAARDRAIRGTRATPTITSGTSAPPPMVASGSSSSANASSRRQTITFSTPAQPPSSPSRSGGGRRRGMTSSRT